ncbi:NAD(P)H-binding protein [Nocardia ninae]|uniref:NmrA family transcriptional regulator n=1 Tax=Nocardia ninae NBRC 108245 TaxID=1210091 RepID=A0A511M8Q0_9NOCA|nr:NAD(P)H-binding protein [Nocardia ninae]GEM37035.1 NmrA family transcriptional regulator [Nocardia ninae NBRC 108245]
MTNSTTDQHRILVTGGTGKTGSRVATRLTQAGHPIRIGSRSADTPFSWEDRGTWPAALAGVHTVYVAYQPDLAVPGAPDAIRAFTAAAVQSGVRRLVLLSGRGEPEAVECEEIVQESGLEWTIVRCSFFAQNFSEGAFTDYILAGEVAMPNGDVPEPFVHADDIADVAVRALTEDGHQGEVYDLTGPRALTFAEAVAEIAAATGREIAFIPVSRTDFVAALTEYQVPADAVSLLDYLFGTILDGRNSKTADGVRRALGREAKDFTEYARETAATGIWNIQG